MINLNTERMAGYGAYKIDSFRVNYLYGLDDLCKKYILPHYTILELGSNDGVSTSIFSQYANTVYSVDKNISSKLLETVSQYQNIRFYHTDFTSFLNNNQIKFDLIYIDGDHDYDSVNRDIRISIPHIKPNGYLSGHDYNSSCPGTIKAVDNHFKNIEIFEDSSWISI